MNCGELLIIGGAEDKCLEGEVLNKFVELATHSEGGIGILPTASEIPGGSEYRVYQDFQGFRCGQGGSDQAGFKAGCRRSGNL